MHPRTTLMKMRTWYFLAFLWCAVGTSAQSTSWLLYEVQDTVGEINYSDGDMWPDGEMVICAHRQYKVDPWNPWSRIGNEALVMLLNEDGTPIWSKKFASPDTNMSFVPSSLHAMGDGSIAIFGIRYNHVTYGQMGFAMGLDHSGEVLWGHIYEKPGEGCEGPWGVVNSVASDNGFFMVRDDYVGFVISRLDANGVPVWSERTDFLEPGMGTCFPKGTADLLLTATGDVLIASNNADEPLVFEIGENGVVGPCHTIVHVDGSHPSGMLFTEDGGVVLAGAISIDPDPAHTPFATKLNADGTTAWQFTYDPALNNWTNVVETASGDLLFSSTTLSEHFLGRVGQNGFFQEFVDPPSMIDLLASRPIGQRDGLSFWGGQAQSLLSVEPGADQLFLARTTDQGTSGCMGTSLALPGLDVMQSIPGAEVGVFTLDTLDHWDMAINETDWAVTATSLCTDVSVSEVSEEDPPIAFPNPVSAGGVLTFNMPKHAVTNITLSDVLGRDVFEFRPVGGESAKVDLPPTLLPGSYSVKLAFRADEQITSFRLVVE